MASQAQNQPPPSNQPRKIIIRPWPFNSHISATLVQALDTELEEMYPDWESLPHPGFARFVGGDHEPPEPWSNPVPVLDALDADTVPPPPPPPPPPAATPSTPHLSDDTPTPEDLSTLHFHIAFDVTDLPDPSSSSSSLQPPSLTSIPSLGTPVGCIGLKAMPYFPSHRLPPSTTPHAPTNPYPHPRHAELKRLYIAPSHRGSNAKITLVTPSPSTNPQIPEPAPTTLSRALISTVQTYARTKHIDKIVLETGCRQIAAIKLYERLGWTRIPDYGDYVGAGVADGGVSMCYLLDL